MLLRANRRRQCGTSKGLSKSRLSKGDVVLIWVGSKEGSKRLHFCVLLTKIERRKRRGKYSK